MTKNEKNTHFLFKKENHIAPITLVDRALEELTARATAGEKKLRETKLKLFCSSLLENNNKSYKIVNVLLKNGISILDLFETYFPEAAKLLGEDWLEDRLSFAQVTIAMTKLQTLTRDYESSYFTETTFDINQPEILIIIPPGESHTFGAQMAYRKFKRLGTSPYLAIGFNLNEIKHLIKAHNFNLIGLSVSDSENKTNCINLLKNLRAQTKERTPIVLGGSVIESNNRFSKNLGVDLSSNNPLQTLDYFQIKTAKQEKFKTTSKNT
jgi:methanogenic corrinoid protein MtbC1